MKNILGITITFVISALLFVGKVGAIGTPSYLDYAYLDDTSVHLNWDYVGESVGYYLYYGTQSGSEGSYEFEGVDLISETNTKIESLSPETKYYFSITSVSDVGEESTYSEELSLTTLAEGQKPEIKDPLQITLVSAESIKSVRIEFSKDLDSSESASREFIIIDSEGGEEIYVLEAKLDETKDSILFLELEQELNTDTKYELTVLDLLGADGTTIEQGVDGFVSFTTPSIFESVLSESEEDTETNSEVPDLNAAGDDMALSTQEQDGEEVQTVKAADDSASSSTVVDNTQNDIQTSEEKTKAGSTLNQEDVNTGTLSVAETIEKLPKTGAEHVILLLIAMILGVGFYVRSLKR